MGSMTFEERVEDFRRIPKRFSFDSSPDRAICRALSLEEGTLELRNRRDGVREQLGEEIFDVWASDQASGLRSPDPPKFRGILRWRPPLRRR